jgi:pectin methylesterase-like acyl-CoA thioesterase
MVLAGTAAAAEPHSAVSVFPADNATEICPDTPLTLTYDGVPATAGKLEIRDGEMVVETVDLGAPNVTRTRGTISGFNTHSAIVDGKSLIVSPAKPLAYGHTYSVQVAGGPASWRFSTKKVPPAAGATKLTVAADSSGDFATLQGALDFVPDNNTTATTIRVKKGTYHEIVAFTNKHNLTITGEDRKETVIVETNNAKLNPQGGPYRRGLFLANRCNDLVIANMTFRNTTPSGGSQAESVILDRVQRAIITDVDLYSLQDTLQINGQAYIQNSYIEGDVDFIWGTGPCFFENVTCKSMRSRAYYTQIRNTAANHGYIFDKCTFIGADGIVDNVLSRIDPGRFPNSEVVLIDCTMTNAVSAAAWRLDNLPAGTTQENVKPEGYPNVHFWEFNSRTPDGKPVDTSRRHPISRQLKEPEDKETIENYRNPTWVLGGNWIFKVPAIDH